MRAFFLLIILVAISSCSFNSEGCKDLLLTYGEAHPKINFIDCTPGLGQTILESNYKVLGENVEEVERFLMTKYDLGKLKMNCCGWESTDGKNGFISNDILTNLHPDYHLEVSLFANAEKENDQGKVFLELDKTKVEFTVLVRLLEI